MLRLNSKDNSSTSKLNPNNNNNNNNSSRVSLNASASSTSQLSSSSNSNSSSSSSSSSGGGNSNTSSSTTLVNNKNVANNKSSESNEIKMSPNFLIIKENENEVIENEDNELEEDIEVVDECGVITENNNNNEEEEIEEDLAYDDDDEDENDGDEEEDDDEDEDEEDEESFLSPMVQVKYGVEYDYDEKKFQLFEGERLFLISKANEDWWLCLRLEENLTFFVPASYVKELIVNKSIKPPPRPPPPPPSILNKYSSINTVSTTSSSSSKTGAAAQMQNLPPQIKKRQFVVASDKATNVTTSNQQENIDLDQIYENLSNLNTKELAENLMHEEKDATSNNNNSNDDYIDSMLKELEDLDESLEKEERSSFVNINKSQSNAHNQNSGLQVCNNKTSDYVRILPPPPFLTKYSFQLQRKFLRFFKI
jgi:hypothetical protein